MAKVIFYEKPSCHTNARQKALLLASGHEVEPHNVLTEPWTVSRLRPFFGVKPVSEWFNPACPRVKSGEVKPDELSPEAALALMVEDPRLIRRPLLQVGDALDVGFDAAKVDAWIGLAQTERPVADVCACQNSAKA